MLGSSSDISPFRGPNWKEARDEKIGAWTAFKYTVSTLLVIFSFLVTVSLILDRETKVSKNASPSFAIVLLCVAIAWLFMVEGGQASMVGLPPVEAELYKDSHPITYKICSIAHKGNNLDRYLIGRQFMVLLIVFTTNQCGAALRNADAFDHSHWFLDIFLSSGITMILMLACLGQLMGQVNASHCMLDFVDVSDNLSGRGSCTKKIHNSITPSIEQLQCFSLAQFLLSFRLTL